MIIRVTQEDIDNGTPGVTRCPVANALSRTFGVPWRVGVSMCRPGVEGEARLLPDEVVNRLEKYDGGYGMGPFEFELC